MRFTGRLTVIAAAALTAGLAVFLSLPRSGSPVQRAHAASHRRRVRAVSLARRVRPASLTGRAHYRDLLSGHDRLVRVWLIHYRAHDGFVRSAYVDLPHWYGPRDDPPVPLIISPHGRSATPAANSALWGNLPARGDFAVVNPEGQGRVLRLYSWGAPGQIADLARMPRIVSAALPWLRIDRRRIYAFGGSMGGQESLLLAARYPHLLAGAAAFDAPVDLARLARVEIGGTPASAPRAYAERSPLTYARRLAFSGVPLQIWWSTADQVVVHGERQSGLLYRRIKELNPEAPVEQAVGAWQHTADMNARTKLPIALLAFGLLPLRPFLATAFEATDSRRAPARVRETAVRSPWCERRQRGGSITARRADAAASYPWPLEPFDLQHPIRGGFGDPRTLFFLTSPSSVRAAGRFGFHDGVDIVGKVGEPVFPVVSGRVAHADRDSIYVRSGSRLFAYWHLRSAVQLGEPVTAKRTVLGFIRPVWRHVHLGESIDGRQVNPLLHLTPYADSTPPVITGLHFTDAAGRTLDPHHLHGLVEIAAGAYDLPSPPVPGAWTDTPVTPALVRWRLTTRTRQPVLPERTVVDFRWTLPEGNTAFWQIYAHGTYQNFPVVGLHYSYRQPGNYLFNLTREPLDTSRLAPGRYTLIVDAADICGNHSTLDEQVATIR